LVLLATLTALVTEASDNKVVNAHFAVDVTHWTPIIGAGFSMGHSSSVGHDALGSMRIDADGTTVVNSAVARQCIGVKQGVSITIGGFYRYQTFSGTVAQGSVEYAWHTSTDCSGVENLIASAGSSGTVGNTWYLITRDDTVPVGANSVRVYLGVTTDMAGVVTGFFDDVFVRSGVAGDVNHDGAVDVGDVFYLINYLFAGGPPPLGPADANSDDDVTVADVFYLINSLFAGGPPPAPQRFPRTLRFSYATVGAEKPTVRPSSSGRAKRYTCSWKSGMMSASRTRISSTCR
jgi:hypothetical protein